MDLQNVEIADLVSAVEGLAAKIDETNRQARVGNVLALGTHMNLDMTNPQDIAKAARHLTVVERNAGAGVHD